MNPEYMVENCDLKLSIFVLKVLRKMSLLSSKLSQREFGRPRHIAARFPTYTESDDIHERRNGLEKEILAIKSLMIFLPKIFHPSWLPGSAGL